MDQCNHLDCKNPATQEVMDGKGLAAVRFSLCKEHLDAHLGGHINIRNDLQFKFVDDQMAKLEGVFDIVQEILLLPGMEFACFHFTKESGGEEFANSKDLVHYAASRIEDGSVKLDDESFLPEHMQRHLRQAMDAYTDAEREAEFMKKYP